MDEMYKRLDDLKSLVSKEIEKINKKGDLSAVELKNATDAVCLLKEIEKIQAENDEPGLAERGYYNRYDMPRHERYENYVSRHRYPRHSINDRIVNHLERMMDETDSDYERSVISDWIAKVEAN